MEPEDTAQESARGKMLVVTSHPPCDAGPVLSPLWLSGSSPAD